MSNPCSLWLGTIERMGWFDTPVGGADMSPLGSTVKNGLINGGAHIRQSWGTHKEYIFEWRDSSARKTAQLMKSYRDGSFGRGLIYFVDPLIYDMNVLPARWADPSITVDYEGPSLVYGAEAEAATSSGGASNGLPVKSAYFDLGSIEPGWGEGRRSVFIPIPEGYTLYLGAVYSSTGSGAVYATPVVSDGVLGNPVALDRVAPNNSDLHPNSFNGVAGIRLWFGKGSTGPASITVNAISGRLFRTGANADVAGPWYGGMGHSGCRFDGEPTYVANTGLNGGRIGFAATFVEVGDSL